MNVNQRELSQHVEFEPNTYYAAFSAELEASAYPMWALVSHLRGTESSVLSRRVLTFCLNALQDWLDAVNYTHPNVVSVPFNIYPNIVHYATREVKSWSVQNTCKLPPSPRLGAVEHVLCSGRLSPRVTYTIFLPSGPKVPLLLPAPDCKGCIFGLTRQK